MYVKLFSSLYNGSLRGKSHPILVFTNMLAHADPHGIVDVHPRAIAEEVGLSIEEVRAAIVELESEDADSRSPEENGKRLILLDEHRNWGWQIVNFLKYRAMKNEDERRMQNQEAQRKWRDKQRNQSSAGVSENKQRKPIQKQKQKQKHSNTCAVFEEFWSVYPTRAGRKVGKQEASTEFAKLVEADQRLAIVAAKNYSSQEKPRDAKRFLQHEFWRDWIEEVSSGPRVATMEERLAAYPSTKV